MKRCLIIILCFVSLASIASVKDHRIRVIPFSKDTVYTVTASTFTATEVHFSPGEIIESIHCGDMAAWTVDVDKRNHNVLFLKPTSSSSNTNLTVITNRHHYFFHLNSTPQMTPTYAIRFTYPNRLLGDLNIDLEQHKGNGKHNTQAKQNWDYRFHGSHDVMPLHVYDDGQFTYFEFPRNRSLPAIFIVLNRQGDEAMVNFRKLGRYIVVNQVAYQFTLRSGRYAVASIFNHDRIKHLSGHH